MPSRGRVVVLHQDRLAPYRLAPYRLLARAAVETVDEAPVPRSPRLFRIEGGTSSETVDPSLVRGRAQLVPTVATLQTDDGEAGFLPLSPAKVQEVQECDAALTHVQKWLPAGRRPEWADVATLDTEPRAYHSQWGSLEARDSVSYQRWRAPGRGADLLQLLVPQTQPEVEGGPKVDYLRRLQVVRARRHI
ncbi:hypothetical protein AAFF_G00119310 [Aldrovandia affinis]|uniref:Uncharacterized protein n=1 Tax=Aldrovandia affinis TaxID=143900 RepID=A0AAD7RV39_9TELE|nr:hypothetical protein AAFF_G00119310 [Aldrovandia affinis]